MSEARSMIADTVERLFSESLDQEDLARAENGVWPTALWHAIEETGLTRALLRPEHGGADGDWLDVFEIARALGRHSVPLPVVETILATWLLERAELDIPDGPLGLVPHPTTTTATRLQRIPWGRAARAYVGLTNDGRTDGQVVCFSGPSPDVAAGCNIALDARDTVTIRETAAVGTTTVAPNTVRLYGALLRSGQMTGALERILDQSVQYATERVQFGRPIGNFQIIQQELARLAGQVAEATTATEIAFRAAAEARPNATGEIGAEGDPAFEIACAKVVVGDAAELGPRIAHQVHGAIGFTYEHSLHFSTRRLWAWRAEFGLAEEWAADLGTAVQHDLVGGIWPLVTSR